MRSFGSTTQRHVYKGGRPCVPPTPPLPPSMEKAIETSARDLEVLPQRKPHAYSVMLLTKYYKPVQAALDDWEESQFIVTRNPLLLRLKALVLDILEGNAAWQFQILEV